jgi:DNA-binding beta-propeller fold protein YncE
MSKRAVLAALALLSFASLYANNAADVERQPVERRLYVADDGGGVRVYDIDRGHQLVRTIAVPNSGVYKGIAASVSLERLYLTSNAPDTLICLDLASDREVWRKTLGSYADSPDITPDGKTLYIPYRHEDNWKAVDAATGQVKATIPVGRGKQYDTDAIADIGPHNTWMNRAGSRVYLEVLTEPYVYIADVATNTLLGKIGPFSKGIRPFAVSDDEQRVYASVDALLGFEIGAVGKAPRWDGPMVQRIEAQVPASRLADIPTPPARKPHSTPSHGINITPDQKEIWMVDGVYGYVHVFDITQPAPKQIAAIPLFASSAERPHPGWVSFSIDGRFAYPDGGAVIDTKTKTVVARIPTTEKLMEIDFDRTRAVAAGRR